MSTSERKPGDRQARVEIQFLGPDKDNPVSKLVSIPSMDAAHVHIVDARKGIVRIEGVGELKNVLRLRFYELVGVAVKLLGIPMGTGCARENQGRWNYVMGEFRTIEQHEVAGGAPSLISYLHEMGCSGIVMVRETLGDTPYPLYPGEQFIG